MCCAEWVSHIMSMCCAEWVSHIMSMWYCAEWVSHIMSVCCAEWVSHIMSMCCAEWVSHIMSMCCAEWVSQGPAVHGLCWNGSGYLWTSSALGGRHRLLPATGQKGKGIFFWGGSFFFSSCGRKGFCRWVGFKETRPHSTSFVQWVEELKEKLKKKEVLNALLIRKLPSAVQ